MDGSELGIFQPIAAAALSLVCIYLFIVRLIIKPKLWTALDNSSKNRVDKVALVIGVVGIALIWFSRAEDQGFNNDLIFKKIIIFIAIFISAFILYEILQSTLISKKNVVILGKTPSKNSTIEKPFIRGLWMKPDVRKIYRKARITTPNLTFPKFVHGSGNDENKLFSGMSIALARLIFYFTYCLLICSATWLVFTLSLFVIK